jgi:hypothetical protein
MRMKQEYKLRRIEGTALHTVTKYEYRGYNVEGRIMGGVNSYSQSQRQRVWSAKRPDGTSFLISKLSNAKRYIDFDIERIERGETAQGFFGINTNR